MLARLLAAGLFLPAFAFAQSDELRAQIRADLMQDPRTAQMSSVELDALVEALAGEAEEQGTAITYLESKNAPTFSYDPAPVTNASLIEIILSSPIVIAILALVAGVLGLVLFMLVHRHRRMPESPIT